MKISVPQKERKEEVVRFLNKVFHKPFPRLIPSLYGKEKNTMEYHFIVEEGDELVGGICAYPEEIKVGNVVVKALGIGMVATGKKHRGKGIMTKMVTHSLEAYSNECDVAMLTGRRHRYEHYGFYPAGANYIYQISEKSISNIVKGSPFTIVRAKTKEDYAMVDELTKLDLQVVSRPLATESETLRNWYSKLYLIKNGEEVVGFASGKYFNGLCLERMFIKNGSPEDYASAVYAYRKQKKLPLLRVEVLPTERAFKEAMARGSEEYMINSHVKYYVFSYKRLVEKLLAIGLEQGSLRNSECIVEIEGREKMKIVTTATSFVVEETTDEPNLILSEQNAIASLLGAEETIVKGMGKFALRHSDFI